MRRRKGKGWRSKQSRWRSMMLFDGTAAVSCIIPTPDALSAAAGVA